MSNDITKANQNDQNEQPEDADSVLSLQEKEAEKADVEAHTANFSSVSALVGGNC